MHMRPTVTAANMHLVQVSNLPGREQLGKASAGAGEGVDDGGGAAMAAGPYSPCATRLHNRQIGEL